MKGELAALTTAFMWSFSSLMFTSAGALLGPMVANRIRLLFAAVILGILVYLATGTLIPAHLPTENLLYLAASAVVGLTIGDSFLFAAFVMLGTRLTMLIFTLSPAVAALFAWVYLGEVLDWLDVVGMAVTLFGVLWVSYEKHPGNGSGRAHPTPKGALFAFLGAAGQAIGLVLAKKGIGEIVPPLTGTFIRMLVGGATVWLLALMSGAFRRTLLQIRPSRGAWMALGGAIFGPVLGVWMSLVAVKHTHAGIAAAIMATTPVLVIPWVAIFYKERVSLKAVVGALIAVGGVFILFLH